MTNMDSLMTLLFVRLYLSRDALLALKKTESTISKIISELLKKNYIRERSVKNKKDKNSIPTTYYCLTLNGLRYLIKKKANKLMSFISEEDLKRATVVGTKPNSAGWLESVLRTNDCAVLAALAGVDVPLVLKYPSLDKRIKEGKMTNTFYFLAIEAEKKMNKKDLEQMRCEIYDIAVNRKAGYSFYSSESVKLKVTHTSVSDKKANDFKKCRFSGALQSHRKSVLFYSFYSSLLNWLDWNASSDRNALVLMNNSVPKDEGHDAIITTGYNAVLLVRNEVHLRRLYEETREKLKVELLEENTYTHFYVVPLCHIGAQNLDSDIMQNDDKKDEEQYLNYMLGIGCKKNPTCSTSFESDFAAITKDGCKTAYGCVMDIKKFNRIKKAVEENPSEKYGVLCYKWQAPYYKAVFKDSIQIYIIEDTDKH